jgi:hypothetical protein
MDKNKQIIADLQSYVGSHQHLDFLSHWKGVPVMIAGHIQEVRKKTIVFRLEAPDSICFAQDEHALILHDVFIMGIQGRILAFDPQDSIAEVGEFIYVDRGFGDRSIVRVEPENPISAELALNGTTISCQVVDISLNGFGLLTKPTEGLEAAKGQDIRLRLNLMDQEIEIPGTLLDVFQKEDSLRLAISFSQDTPYQAIVTRYITRRRADIRQEIEAAYQHAVGVSSQ